MKNQTQFKDQSIEELNSQYRELSRAIYALKNESVINRKMEKPHLLREKKRNRARVLTALHMKGGSIT